MTPENIPPHLFAYCERAGDPGLWAEPLNFITNGFFILYAWLGYRELKKLPTLSFRATGDIWGLIVAMVLIGVGSGLWHSWAAAGWTVIVDTIPIYIFINIYIFSMFRRLAELGWFKCVTLWVVFTALNTVIQQSLPISTLNGSLLYIPTLLLMLVSGLFLIQRKLFAGKELIVLSGLFFVSLCFRTFDAAACEMIPFGTHFIWHALNSVLLFRLVRLLVTKTSAL